jgi:hypothetical protein
MDIFEERNEGLILNLENLTKSSLKSFADKIVNNVNEGNANALEEYIKAKGLSEALDIIIESLKTDAVSEAEKYIGDQSVMGCKVLIKNTPVTYDYSHNPDWVELSGKIELLKLQQKEIEKKMVLSLAYSIEGVEPAIVKGGGGQTIQVTIPK